MQRGCGESLWVTLRVGHLGRLQRVSCTTAAWCGSGGSCGQAVCIDGGAHGSWRGRHCRRPFRPQAGQKRIVPPTYHQDCTQVRHEGQQSMAYTSIRYTCLTALLAAATKRHEIPLGMRGSWVSPGVGRGAGLTRAVNSTCGEEGCSASGRSDQVQLPQGSGVVVGGGSQQRVNHHPPRRNPPVRQMTSQLLRGMDVLTTVSTTQTELGTCQAKVSVQL